jgi:hypothetical protein
MNIVASIPAALIDLPISGTAAAAVGLLIFGIVAALAFVLFRILRKSIRMAIRLAVVVAVLFIAVLGGISLWWFGGGDAPASKPAPARRR